MEMLKNFVPLHFTFLSFRRRCRRQCRCRRRQCRCRRQLRRRCRRLHLRVVYQIFCVVACSFFCRESFKEREVKLYEHLLCRYIL